MGEPSRLRRRFNQTNEPLPPNRLQLRTVVEEPEKGLIATIVKHPRLQTTQTVRISNRTQSHFRPFLTVLRNRLAASAIVSGNKERQKFCAATVSGFVGRVVCRVQTRVRSCVALQCGISSGDVVSEVGKRQDYPYDQIFWLACRILGASMLV